MLLSPSKATFRNFFETEIPKELGKKIDIDDNFENYRPFMKKCAEMGIFGLMVPEEFGGTNLGTESVQLRYFFPEFRYICYMSSR